MIVTAILVLMNLNTVLLASMIFKLLMNTRNANTAIITMAILRNKMNVKLAITLNVFFV